MSVEGNSSKSPFPSNANISGDGGGGGSSSSNSKQRRASHGHTMSTTTNDRDGPSSSQINASNIVNGSSLGTTISSTGHGSLPRQYPGRTYYYRAPGGSVGAQQAMSFTQSHFDIREGSARLASLGLAQDFNEEAGNNDDNNGIDTSNGYTNAVASGSGSQIGNGKTPYISQSWSNNARNTQDAFSRNNSSSPNIDDEHDPDDALTLALLAKTPTPISSASSGQNTPSGLSVLLQKHEGKQKSRTDILSAESSPGSSSAGSNITQKAPGGEDIRGGDSGKVHEGKGDIAQGKKKTGDTPSTSSTSAITTADSSSKDNTDTTHRPSDFKEQGKSSSSSSTTLVQSDSPQNSSQPTATAMHAGSRHSVDARKDAFMIEKKEREGGNVSSTKPATSLLVPPASSKTGETTAPISNSGLARAHALPPPKRKTTLDATVEQATLGLPESYSERSPLLRVGRSPSKKSSITPSYNSTTGSTETSGAANTITSQQSSQQRRRTSASRSPCSSAGDRQQAHAAYGSGAAARWTQFFDDTKTKLLRGAQNSAETAYSLRKRSTSDLALTFLLEPLKTIPSVVLGILMNLLDGVSYGMIMFPVSSPVFATFGGIGVSMFFASCFVSQVIYSSRSIFKGGNGSMMIEVVPFLHVIAFSISDRLGGMENAHAVVATTMIAYSLTSILTGLAFFLLGYLRLGAYIEFFPRVVLVGCIGGVGAFLVITGVQVCAGLENEHLDFSFAVIKRFFETQLFILWFIPLVLAVIIRVVTSSRFDHPLVFPAFFLLIPVVFYIIVFAARIPISTLRENGWIFQLQGVNTPWYEYFKLFDFKATDFGAVLETIPTQLALVFFALLHVPINVPALALSVGEDNVDTDTELVNHGLSNFLSGCVGSIPNYLVYTNSVLFYRVGGTTRLSSFMLAIATLAVFLIGPWVIGYLPVMIVGTLIYILGYDLLKEAVWDTYGRVSGFDYTTIWIIVAAMTYFDFVIGIGVGIVAACVSFVIVSSQRQPIRAIMSGSTASSTVRRHPRQSTFLRRVGSQIRIIKLQSFLFFGTVVKVEAKIRELLEAAVWETEPIRYLILDFSLASGVDFSAAEAFLRIQRLLEVREVVLVLCGCDPDTPVGRSLQNIELFQDTSEGLVRVFANLNDALEHCENSQLRSLYSKTLEVNHEQQQDMTRLGIDSPYRLAAQDRPADLEGFSPRRAHLLHAAKETLVGRKLWSEPSSIAQQASSPSQQTTTPTKPAARPTYPEPVRLLMQALGSYAPELKEEFFVKLTPYFTKMKVAGGQVLWQSHDMADSFYVLESGILKAVYNFRTQYLDTSPRAAGGDPNLQHVVSESMLPGTIAGEMTFLAGTRRNATVVAERDCTLWKMSSDQLKRLEEKEGPGVARSFRQMLLRVSAESADVLLGHLISG